MPGDPLVKIIETSIKKNWRLPALSDYGGGGITYGESARWITGLHELFKKAGVKAGDKIALVGRNSVNWALCYLSAITYGAAIVPILPDFPSEDMENTINHSDSVLLFASEAHWVRLDAGKMPALRAAFSLGDFSQLTGGKEMVFRPRPITSGKFHFKEQRGGEPAAIIYTSGTTGFSKGVILTHANLAANITCVRKHQLLKAGEPMLSFLPLAHAYGCTFDFLYAFSEGCHITLIDKVPTPTLMKEAFAKIKPRVVLMVPLILEKIYQKQIRPFLGKAHIRALRKIPLFESIINRAVKRKLKKFFGGHLREAVVGGAALNREVEAFLMEIGFPISVGYGMTECGPLISYSPSGMHRLCSAGQCVDTLEVEIDSPRPHSIPGEILVRGINVMPGYYKNEEATNSALDKGGWLHTGDLGVVDKDGFLYIRGRIKTMILGPSGQNIYPEEMESKLNSMPLVQESLVLERGGRIVALVSADREQAGEEGLGEKDLARIMEENRKLLNKKLPSYSHVSAIEIRDEEFEKTPTKKIKRFLYK